MAQASGKGGRYRYYKCGTRLAKGNSRCDSRNLPRAYADHLVLSALSEQVFTPSRVSMMLGELARRRRAARTVENTRLVELRRALDTTKTGLGRLYDAVERGALPEDDTLRARAHSLQVRRHEAFAEIAKLEDHARLASIRIDPAKNRCVLQVAQGSSD